jgi:hypothetical protein
MITIAIVLGIASLIVLGLVVSGALAGVLFKPAYEKYKYAQTLFASIWLMIVILVGLYFTVNL